jgi:hypothetical protein
MGKIVLLGVARDDPQLESRIYASLASIKPNAVGIEVSDDFESRLEDQNAEIRHISSEYNVPDLASNLGWYDGYFAEIRAAERYAAESGAKIVRSEFSCHQRFKLDLKMNILERFLDRLESQGLDFVHNPELLLPMLRTYPDPKEILAKYDFARAVLEDSSQPKTLWLELLNEFRCDPDRTPAKIVREQSANYDVFLQVCKISRLFEDYQGKSLYSRLKDLSPERRLAIDFSEQM